MFWIWHKTYVNGKFVGSGVSARCYARKGNAERAARSWFHDTERITYEWTVAEENPWERDVDHDFLDEYWSRPDVCEGWHQQDIIDMYRRER